MGDQSRNLSSGNQSPGNLSSGDLRIDRHAPVDRREFDATSWVDLVKGFVVDSDAEFAALREQTPWQQNEILRYDKYVPEKRLGAGLAADRSPLLRQTSMHLRSKYGVEFTGVGALLYRDGDDFQGLHSDREMRWLDDTLIAIVVLGERRPFVFRKACPCRATRSAGSRATSTTTSCCCPARATCS